jgi:RNA polymerase sigma-70 factor (ECF subfamily)
VRNRRKSGEDVQTSLYIAPLHGEAGVEGYLALQPETDSPDFRNEFVLAANADAAPARLQDLLEDRFGWKTDISVERRSTLLDLLARTLVDPLRQRFQSRTDDAELIRQAKADREAFGLLVAKYFGTVRRYFQYRLSDPDLAEDLAQETFERAFRALPRFESSNASYQTYLLHIAHNLLVSEYRRGGPSIVEKDVAHAAWMERLEAKDEVDRAMDLLESLDREALTLFYQEGYSIREIAARLSTSENAVKLRLSRARRRMATHARRSEKGVA